MFTDVVTAEFWVSLATLSAMEIVLGIDNVIFIAILTARLPKEQQSKARQIGLFLAMFARLALLFSINWVMSLREPVFSALGRGFSGRDLILLGGGLFLMGKATHEIHGKLEAPPPAAEMAQRRGGFALILGQIILLDIVFSLDSVITAVGMAQSVAVMAIAMVLAVAVMLAFSGRISGFVERHPTVKILALSFLILIGVMLVAESMGQHIGKGYIYFAMAFSLLVEVLNIRLRKVTAAQPPASPEGPLNP
ncbi:MAG: TerC family protein [Myxococcales bacterium]|nr:TerC family protein [Myxococcales bacterium]